VQSLRHSIKIHRVSKNGDSKLEAVTH